ncbi:hypothetical protein AgCh_033970 [Apium graveolens]
MTDSDILAAVKALQTQFDSQTMAVHQTLQKYMASVDSRMEELRSQVQASSHSSKKNQNNSNQDSSSTEVPHTGLDITPVLRSMKMEVPKFDGSDPNGWAFRIEEFFDFHGTEDSLRLRIVSFHLEGRASAWYQWMKVNNLLTSWKEFLQNLKLRFGASMYDDHEGNLSKLTQKTSVADYQSEFEDLMNKMTARTYEARVDESKQDSRIWSKWSPKSHAVTSNIPYNSKPNPTNQATTPTITTPPKPQQPQTLPPLLPKPDLPIRSKFLMLLGTDDNDVELCSDSLSDEIETVDTAITGDISSLNALAGQGNPRSLRMFGEIGTQNVQTLIDSGSTHNFIKPTVVERLRIPVQATQPLRVYIGNGDFLVCQHFCPQVSLTLQGTIFLVDLFVLPIEGPDIVLGIQWLQKLGRVSHDYAALTMEFTWQDKKVSLRGDSSIAPQIISFNQLQVLHKHDGIHSMFELYTLSSELSASDTLEFPKDLPPDVTNLLHRHQEAVHKWRQYLLGRFFIIRTDHKSIKELLQQVIQTPDQQAYVYKLLGYNFRIEYKPGRTNLAADALSRIHEEQSDVDMMATDFTCLHLASQPISDFLHLLKSENASLSDLVELHNMLKAGTLSCAYSTHDGILLFRQRYYIGNLSQLKPRLLHEFHATPLAGHSGIKRILVRLSSVVFWPNMRRDVEKYIAACLVYQQTKYSTQAPAGLLQPLPVPNLVWDELTMDFITGLPSSRGFTVILVVVDRLTKFAHFGPLPTHFTASKTAELFAEIVIKFHGFPSSIISDRDPIFVSLFWKTLFELSGTTLHHSTAYHPQTDGQTEVVNRGLEQYLRAFTHDCPSAWVNYLCWAEFCYNSSYHTSLQMSPYQALFGRLPPTIPMYIRGSTSIQALDELLHDRDNLLRALKDHLLSAQNRMKQKADSHRREITFAEGDQVLVHLQPYRQISVAHRSSHKLSKRYFGPFSVVKRIGSVAYKLDLPADSKIHPVFHVSRLKRYHDTVTTPASFPLPPESFNNQPLSLPIVVCATRHILQQGKVVRQVLVQWSDSSPENATWESFAEFCQTYPDFHLEDKVVFEGITNDTTLPGPDSTLKEVGPPMRVSEKIAEIQSATRPKRNTKTPTDEIYAPTNPDLGAELAKKHD